MPSVLIVDDHVDICKALQRLLTATGVSAACVNSGADALAFLDGARDDDAPVVVLLDLSMPDMDGVETLERMRASGFNGVVVMFTAMCDEEIRRRVLGAGANDCWRKGSFDPGRITEMLSGYLSPRPPKSPAPN